MASSSALHAVTPPHPVTIDPQPLIGPKALWLRLAGPITSIAILAAIAYQLRTTDFHEVVALFPTHPLFWLCFAAYYLAGPLSEWVIFRRLWRLPPNGFAALLRKLVSNEILLGYSGELYFYTWARRHARLAAAPFGAIKDVAILSAIVGNGFCLIMVLLAWPLLSAMQLGSDTNALTASACVILVTSGAAMFFRRRLFTLPRADLLRIGAIHAARIVSMTALAALMWHLLLPTVALGWWLVLGAARQLVSRLPLLPNKDLAFAGVAAMLVGGEANVAAAMTLMASLLLVAHLIVGAAVSLGDFAGRGQQ